MGCPAGMTLAQYLRAPFGAIFLKRDVYTGH